MTGVDREQWREVAQIEGPGNYRIAKPRLLPDGQIFPNNNTEGDPSISPQGLIRHLNRSFPDMQRVVFNAAKFYDGEVTPLQLYYEALRLDPQKGMEELIDVDGHITSFSYSWVEVTGRNTYYRLSLADSGHVEVLRNRLDVRGTYHKKW